MYLLDLGMTLDSGMVAQMRECQKRSETNPNSFRQIGVINIYVNPYGRKLERVTVHGNITYREHKD